MEHRERVIAAFKGEKVDRPPLSIWHHWPEIDKDPITLSKAEIEQQNLYDFDFIKVTPNGFIGVEDWGVTSGPPFNDHGEPTAKKFGVNCLEDWEKIFPISPEEGRLSQEIRALELISKGLGKSAVIFQTIFFPLSNAGKLAGPRLLNDLRENPDVVKRGLSIITDTTIKFIRSCLINGGVDGLFLSTKFGDASIFNSEEYQEFALPYELQVLEAISDLNPITILHLHGRDVMFKLFKNYPVNAINWHDRNGKMSISEAKAFFTQGLIAGLSNDTEYLLNSTNDQLKSDVKNAIKQADGTRITIGPGCVFPTGMPQEKIFAIRHAVEY